jgi:hypothetical protein
MNKILISILSITAGLLVFYWGSPVNGHLQLKINDPKDWIIMTLLIIFWAIPIHLFFTYIFKGKKKI